MYILYADRRSHNHIRNIFIPMVQSPERVSIDTKRRYVTAIRVLRTLASKSESDFGGKRTVIQRIQWHLHEI